MADRISVLPDGVLCHILSFLPTRVVVSTSVLSKRWKSLWRSVSAFNVEFAYKYGYVNCKFHYSMNSFLSSRDALQSLRRFHLTCYYHKRRICHHTIYHPTVVFPSVVLSCKTLEVLKLTYSVLKDFSSVDVDLPLLETMHLHCVSFANHRLFAHLLSGCPNLVDLEITGSLRIVNNATESKFKKLPKLVRAVVSKDHVPLEVVSHVQFLCINSV